MSSEPQSRPEVNHVQLASENVSLDYGSLPVLAVPGQKNRNFIEEESEHAHDMTDENSEDDSVVGPGLLYIVEESPSKPVEKRDLPAWHSRMSPELGPTYFAVNDDSGHGMTVGVFDAFIDEDIDEESRIQIHALNSSGHAGDPSSRFSPELTSTVRSSSRMDEKDSACTIKNLGPLTFHHSSDRSFPKANDAVHNGQRRNFTSNVNPLRHDLHTDLCENSAYSVAANDDSPVICSADANFVGPDVDLVIPDLAELDSLSVVDFPESLSMRWLQNGGYDHERIEADDEIENAPDPFLLKFTSDETVTGMLPAAYADCPLPSLQLSKDAELLDSLGMMLVAHGDDWADSRTTVSEACREQAIVDLDHPYALPLLEKDGTLELADLSKPDITATLRTMLRATGLVFRSNSLTEDDDESPSVDLFGGSMTAEEDCSNSSEKIPSSSAPSGLGSRRKLNKVLQREQTDLIEEMSTTWVSCICEQIHSVGANGNLDRFSLDINNNWRDRKSTVASWTPIGLRTAINATVCQAVLSIDEELYKCCRPIARSLLGNLYRSSPAVPLQALCDIHVANLRNHHCCAGCGIFCEVGEFRTCNKNQGHFYHDACQDKDTSDDFRCRHCVKASHHVALKIEHPSFVQLSVGRNGGRAVLQPRQPSLLRENSKSKYSRDFPLGFRVGCAYLPAGHAKTLQNQLQDLDMQTRIQMTCVDFINAIFQGDLLTVLHFLLFPANLEQLYKIGQASIALAAPVQIAIKQRQLVILSVLLQAGFPFDVKSKDEFLPFEYAAVIGNTAAVMMLKTFYENPPCSAVRESSLRGMLKKKMYDGVAILFHYNFYNFDEFHFTDGEIYEAMWELFSSKNPVSITHFTASTNVADVLQRRDLGTKILSELMRTPGNDFALHFFLSIAINSDVQEGARLDLLSERISLRSSGLAVPPSASRRMKSRHRVLLSDLSLGRESNPVPVINDLGNDLPAIFKYVTQHVVESEKKQLAVATDYIRPSSSCWMSCSRGLPCRQSCSCVRQGCLAVARDRPCYTRDGRLDMTAYKGQVLCECSSSCSCGSRCGNCVVCKPSKGHFQIYRFAEETTLKWGLRTVYSLPRGYFVGRLVGSLMPLSTLSRSIRPISDEIFIVSRPGKKEVSVDQEHLVAVVTREYGNYTRFISRAPDGNVIAVAAISDDGLFDLPHIALFTKNVVEAGEPLILDTTDSLVTVHPPLRLPEYHLSPENSLLPSSQ